MLVKFSTIAGGVFIEVKIQTNYAPDSRCFRFDERGNAEYAFLSDLKENSDRARWYGHCFTSRDFIFA